LDCHTDTQIRGGFHRKLDADQVILYRNDWIVCVARGRAKAEVIPENTVEELDGLTTMLDTLREQGKYQALAIRYDGIGNAELRDKYIELALERDSSDDTVIFLRTLQGKSSLIPKKSIQRQIARQRRNQDWSQLARTYDSIGDFKNAALHYTKSVLEDIEEDNIFSAAYYLKELVEAGIISRLFQEAYRRFHDKRDLWWQVRCLEELDWQKELDDLLISHRSEIERSGDVELLQRLYSATGETEKLHVQMKRAAEFEE
jgi:hypothetical protein